MSRNIQLCRKSNFPGEIYPFFLLILLFFHGLSSGSFAAVLPLTSLYEVEGVEYDEQVPKIEDVIGFQTGSRHTPPYQIIEYFKTVAAASDRVSFLEYGRTYEGVPLICAIVTSPDNQAGLEAIRLNNLRLSEQPGSFSPDSLKNMPLIVYIGSGIHGNEASGGEASMLLLYHLAAGRGEGLEKLLSEMVILIDPMINPDGRNRFTEWVNGNRGRIPTADLLDREHNEPWPGGRANHYWFDMNRDLVPAALKETGHRLKLYHSWRPQLVSDHHEQGSKATFFFQPGIPSGNNPNTPKATVNLTGKIAEYHARELDRIGSLYFSEEVYDDFYYGKGSTYPDINGAVGILFEQASSRALKTQGADGVMSYAFTIRNQLATMMSTLEAGHDLRLELLMNQKDFYSSVDNFYRESKVKGYVFSMPEDPLIAKEFISLLHQHKIKVFRLGRQLKIEEAIFGPENSWMVPLNQTQGRLVKALFEEVTEFNDVVFYDVSSWTLPHAYGLLFKEVNDSLDKFMGSEVLSGDLAGKGEIKGGKASYAYVLKWDFWTPRILYSLQDKGISARAFSTEIEVGTTSEKVRIDGTSVIIPVVQKEVSAEEVHTIVRGIADDYPVEIYAVDSGASIKGPYLGSSSAQPLRKPVIALLTGEGINSREAGEAWFVLDEKMGIPVSLLDRGIIAGSDLSGYNCLILPGGSYKTWKEPEIEKIKSWVKSGGTLIAIRKAVDWAITSELVDEELVQEEEISLNVPYAELSKANRARSLSGAIFETRLDNTHPLVFGFRETLPVMRDHTTKMKPSKIPGANVAVYSNSPLLSGYLPKEQEGKIDNTASIIARKSGKGSIILFLDDPNFRGHWWGTARIFLNAVFLGNSF